MTLLDDVEALYVSSPWLRLRFLEPMSTSAKDIGRAGGGGGGCGDDGKIVSGDEDSGSSF